MKFCVMCMNLYSASACFMKFIKEELSYFPFSRMLAPYDRLNIPQPKLCAQTPFIVSHYLSYTGSSFLQLLQTGNEVLLLFQKFLAT